MGGQFSSTIFFSFAFSQSMVILSVRNVSNVLASSVVSGVLVGILPRLAGNSG